MFLVDYHTHPYAHGGKEVEPGYDLNYLRMFVESAKKREIKSLGFSDHDRFLDKINWDNLNKIKEESKIEICLGLEFDFRPEKENGIRAIISNLNLDYTIGSVHAIGDWEVDHPDYIAEYNNWNINDVYLKYFNLVKQSISSGLFDIMGHFDLIKVFGFKPTGINIISLVEPLLKLIKKKEMIIEINTNGFNKPVSEQYPAKDILIKIHELDIPITFGSDAHNPKRVGEGIKTVARMVQQIGFKEIAVFHEGKFKLKSLK